MALLAVIALGVTVFVAQRALSHASDVVIRGEADALVSTIVADLAQEGAPPTNDLLAHELSTHDDKGLRYVAVVERDRMIAEAGTALMPDAKLRPGESMVHERRVRVAGFVPPMRGSGAPRRGPSLVI